MTPLMSSREKPLLIIQVNFGPSRGVIQLGVFKDDTPSTVADRALREVGARFQTATE